MPNRTFLASSSWMFSLREISLSVWLLNSNQPYLDSMNSMPGGSPLVCFFFLSIKYFPTIFKQTIFYCKSKQCLWNCCLIFLWFFKWISLSWLLWLFRIYCTLLVFPFLYRLFQLFFFQLLICWHWKCGIPSNLCKIASIFWLDFIFGNLT